ncbi:MAG: hypothetical protein HOQ02_03495 [Lysobacter sp.]|nr:hypothetical protein [Lysobacter sp.]
MPRLSRTFAFAVPLSALLAGCATPPPAPPPPPTQALPAPPPPTTTRGEFTIAALPLDVWNAIGDVVVRTPDAGYDSRAQMLGLYAVHYRGEQFLLLAHALPLSESIRVLTTSVTARTPDGAPIDSDASAGLLAVLQQELPAEIERVHARQAAADAAEKAAATSHAAKKAKKKTRRGR